MPIERFFIDSPLNPNDVVVMTDKELHHLAHVIRIKPGETVELVNGKGCLAKAVVEDIQKKAATLSIDTVHQEPKVPFYTILVQAIPRINRLDFILEKGTELGMSELWLFPGDNSERKTLTEHQLLRLQAISIAAMKQCGRLYLPAIKLTKPLIQWKSLPLPSFFGDLAADAPLLSQQWNAFTIEDGVLFFIGPESGLSENEEKKLLGLGASGVKLHKNILRTDTAALSALAIIGQLQKV